MRESNLLNYIGIRLPGDRPSPNRQNPCSLVTYVKDVQELGQNEIKALKMTVGARPQPARSAIKHDRSRSGKKVQFAQFVVEKEKNDIYLTRMNSELAEDNAWKSKIIVDRMVIEQLPKHLLPFPPNGHSNKSKLNTLRGRSYSELVPGHSQAKPEMSSFAPVMNRGFTIWEGYKKKILKLAYGFQSRLREVSVPKWSRYLAGIFCWLRTSLYNPDMDRQLLLEVVKETVPNEHWIQIYHQHVREQHRCSNNFMRNDELSNYGSRPLVLLNGKMEYWNSLLDYALRQNVGSSVFKTREFMELITGLPIKEESVKEIPLLADFIKHYSQFVLFAESKTECYRVTDLITWDVKDQGYELVCIASFSEPTFPTIRSSPLYDHLSNPQKLLLDKLYEQHQYLIELEVFRSNCLKLFVTAHLKNGLTRTEHIIGGNRVLFFDSRCQQSIVLRISPQTQQQTVLALAEMFKDSSEVLYKSWLRGGFLTEYHFLKKGYFELQAEPSCKVEVFSSLGQLLTTELSRARARPAK